MVVNSDRVEISAHLHALANDILRDWDKRDRRENLEKAMILHEEIRQYYK